MRKMLLLLVILPLTGCITGSKTVEHSFIGYNKAVCQNQRQQLLLNLVRMRYRETPCFLKTSSLNVGYSQSMSIGGNHSTPATRVRTWGFNFSANTSEKPTVTYSPVEGKEFQEKMLKKFDPKSFMSLVEAGWPLEMLISVMVKDGIPDGLDASKVKIVKIVDGQVKLDDKAIQMQSLNDVFFEMAKGVQVPDSHVKFTKEYESKPAFKVVTDLTLYRYVAVRHRGTLFCIDDTDIKSKDYFALLNTLYNMVVNEESNSKPLLLINSN